MRMVGLRHSLGEGRSATFLLFLRSNFLYDALTGARTRRLANLERYGGI